MYYLNNAEPLNHNMPDESEIYAALLFSCIYCSIVYVCGQLLKKCLSHVFCLLDSHSTLEFGETSESASSISSLPRDDCSGRHRQNEQPQNAAGVSKVPNSPLWSDEVSNAAFTLATDSTGGMPSLSLPQPPFYAALLSPLHKSLQDAVSTFQLCACSLENGIVRATFGIKGLILVIGVHNLIMTQLAWADSYGSPCNAFYRYLNCKTSVTWMLVSWGFQLMGAFAALHLSYFWLSLHTTSYHATQLATKLAILDALEHPTTATAAAAGDLTVSVPAGMLIEGGAAFIDVLLAGVLSHAVLVWSRRRRQQQSAQHVQPLGLTPDPSTDLFVQTLIFSIRQSVGLYLTYNGLPLTGLYVNPANAVIQTWGLGRAQPLPHLLVYWLSPMLGIWMAFHTCEHLLHCPRRGPPAFPPLVPCALPPLAMDTGAEMSDSELLTQTCQPVTVANSGFQKPKLSVVDDLSFVDGPANLSRQQQVWSGGGGGGGDVGGGQ
ncbi:hypothetical protein SprV_0902704700 [Sparganum proliferum]